jgi:hypothetical protein
MSFCALTTAVIGIVLFLAREEAADIIALVMHRIHRRFWK